MPETIISQYQRAYNSPIETSRQVNTSTDRDNIPSSVRWRGMLVHVLADDVTYELVGGIDNGSWQPITGLRDAPSDGETYGRRNGAWAILDMNPTSFTDLDVSVIATGGGADYQISSKTCTHSKIGKFNFFTIDINGVTNVGGSASGWLALDGFPTGVGGPATVAANVNGSGENHIIAYASFGGTPGQVIFSRRISSTDSSTLFPAPDSPNMNIDFQFFTIDP